MFTGYDGFAAGLGWLRCQQRLSGVVAAVAQVKLTGEIKEVNLRGSTVERLWGGCDGGVRCSIPARTR